MCTAAAGALCCGTSRLAWKTGARKAAQVGDCCGTGSSYRSAADGSWVNLWLLCFPVERPQEAAALPRLLGEACGEPQQLRFSNRELFLSRSCWKKWSLCGKRHFLSGTWFRAVASADLWLLALIFVASGAPVCLLGLCLSLNLVMKGSTHAEKERRAKHSLLAGLGSSQEGTGCPLMRSTAFLLAAGTPWIPWRPKARGYGSCWSRWLR